MALQLSGNYREEALRAELVRTLPPDIFKLLFPDSAPAGPMTLGALGGIDWRRFTANLPPVLGPDHASNEWVVDGTLTRSGKPLLANDPHLGLSAPILWYLARIVTPEGSVAGVTFPGVPYTILGHNDRVAWGATTTGGDVQDLFVEDVLPSDPTRYKTPDGDAAFTSRDEIIKVRFGQDVHLTVRASRHGPILSDIEPELAAAVGPDKAVALSFIGLDPDDTTVLAFRGIDRARDWPSFQAALKLWISPEQNIVYADMDGHIAFTSVGELPIRKRPTDDFPAPGASGVADWIGVSQFSQLPQAVDPPSHRFINANNRVVPADYPLYITHAYSDDPFRAERITAMLDDRTGLTAEDFGRMQIDVKEQDADLLMPRLRVAEPKTEAGRRAIDLLRAWNRTMPVDRAEPLIYAAWVARLKETLIGRTLAADSTGARAFGFGFSPFLLVRLLDREGKRRPRYSGRDARRYDGGAGKNLRRGFFAVALGRGPPGRPHLPAVRHGSRDRPPVRCRPAGAGRTGDGRPRRLWRRRPAAFPRCPRPRLSRRVRPRRSRRQPLHHRHRPVGQPVLATLRRPRRTLARRRRDHARRDCRRRRHQGDRAAALRAVRLGERD